MAIFKNDRQVEFAELVARLGWNNNARLATALGITRQAVGMYLKGDSSPSERTLGDLRRIVSESGQSDSAPNDQKLEEEPGESNDALWKRRALAAEALNEEFRRGLRKLLELNTTPPPEEKNARDVVVPKHGNQINSLSISQEGKFVAASVSAEADRQLSESSTPSSTDAHKKRAGEYAPRSSPPTKTPRPGTPTPGKA